MKKLISELNDIGNSYNITFVERPYISTDGYTVMGEIKIKYLLFVPYRDTEAGSNPREFNGLKKSNLEIFKSMLSYPETFRFLHSGFIISAISVKNSQNHKMTFTDACLTNGNQTRFLFLITTILLLYKATKKSLNLNSRLFNDFINENFSDTEAFDNVLKRVGFPKVQQILNYLKANGKYQKIFDRLDINDFLNTKVRVQVNLLTDIVESFETEADEYSIGTLIAEANNDTQNVKKDDIFGNKYKNDLEKTLFSDFEKYNKNIKIEYRQGEIIDNNKVHILFLLRPVVAVGLLTKETQIFGYSNQREPIYRLFANLFKNKRKFNKTLSVVSKIIPTLFDIRKNILSKALEKHKRSLITKYIQKGINGDLDQSIIGDRIKKSNYNEDVIKKEVKILCRYNIEHIAPVLFYRLRYLFKLSEDGNKIILDVKDEDKSKLIESLSEAIYSKYVSDKFNGLPSSLTTLVRRSDFYKYGEETYIALKSHLNLIENDFISQNRISYK